MFHFSSVAPLVALAGGRKSMGFVENGGLMRNMALAGFLIVENKRGYSLAWL
jgi:hypothetical protein